MNIEWFIARRMTTSEESPFSAFIIKIAILAIALSLGIMIIATSVVYGFKKEISEKIFGFSGHIIVSSFEGNRSIEESNPVSKEQLFYPHIDTLESVRSVEVYAHKAGMLKTDSLFEGLIFKGIDTDFNWNFFEKYLKKGTTFSLSDTARSNKIVVSEYTANRLMVDVGDKLLAYFPDKRLRYRKFEVTGVYKTGLAEYDKQIALIDIQHIQKLNKWERNEVGGFKVTLNDLSQIESVYNELYYKMTGPELNTQSIRDVNPGIFDWLELQNMNERIILSLMVLIGIINMTTALLILILERTNMIGILKAMGADSFSIQKIFLINAAFIIAWGLFWGNLFGLGICYIQKTFEIIQLPEDSYYLKVAPVYIRWWVVLLLNAGTFVVSLLALVIPSWMVNWVKPVKAIRFE